MKKDEQLVINSRCEKIWEQAMEEFNRKSEPYFKGERLLSCTAWVHETPNFYVLRSYQTFVACIDKRDCICYDVLRGVYGYTSTSAQHIRKFFHEYLGNRYIVNTYREV